MATNWEEVNWDDLGNIDITKLPIDSILKIFGSALPGGAMGAHLAELLLKAGLPGLQSLINSRKGKPLTEMSEADYLRWKLQYVQIEDPKKWTVWDKFDKEK